MKANTRIGTVALVVRFEGEQVNLIETLADNQEIELFEAALKEGSKDPMKYIEQHRQRQDAEDETFGDYVEQLLTQPFIKAELREHGINWFYSRMRVERYRRHEQDAAKVIAEYALKVYRDAPDREEFILAGPRAKVQIRIFSVNRLDQENEAA